MKPTLIIISGPPCAGKTTLAQKLFQRYRIPYFTKDQFKESLFDSIGWKDRKQSKKLGIAAYDMLYMVVETLLSVGQSCIIESNFKPEFDNTIFQQMQKKYTPHTVQIQVQCDGEVLLERFSQRAHSGERHPGHVDTHNLDEFKPLLLKGKHEELDIEGDIIHVDTTDFEKVDYDSIYAKVDTLQAKSLKHF